MERRVLRALAPYLKGQPFINGVKWKPSIFCTYFVLYVFRENFKLKSYETKTQPKIRFFCRTKFKLIFWNFKGGNWKKNKTWRTMFVVSIFKMCDFVTHVMGCAQECLHFFKKWSNSVSEALISMIFIWCW